MARRKMSELRTDNGNICRVYLDDSRTEGKYRLYKRWWGRTEGKEYPGWHEKHITDRDTLSEIYDYVANFYWAW